jgi:hypothetical protein
MRATSEGENEANILTSLCFKKQKKEKKRQKRKEQQKNQLTHFY